MGGVGVGVCGGKIKTRWMSICIKGKTVKDVGDWKNKWNTDQTCTPWAAENSQRKVQLKMKPRGQKESRISFCERNSKWGESWRPLAISSVHELSLDWSGFVFFFSPWKYMTLIWLILSKKFSFYLYWILEWLRLVTQEDFDTSCFL